MADDIVPTTETPFFKMWRPWIGWVAAVGFTLQFVAFPILNAAFTVANHPLALPMIDTSAIIAMVTTTVGLGGMRSWEKFKGIQTNH